MVRRRLVARRLRWASLPECALFGACFLVQTAFLSLGGRYSALGGYALFGALFPGVLRPRRIRLPLYEPASITGVAVPRAVRPRQSPSSGRPTALMARFRPLQVQSFCSSSSVISLPAGISIVRNVGGVGVFRISA